jgi:hypothetical protein
MTEERINYFGNELMQKTYDENCQIKIEWEKLDSLKLKSLYLPYFIHTYEIVGTRNDLMFDDMLNKVNLYYHPKMSLYMATFGQQIIYHTTIYMIINKFPGSKSNDWKRLR